MDNSLPTSVFEVWYELIQVYFVQVVQGTFQNICLF